MCATQLFCSICGFEDFPSAFIGQLTCQREVMMQLFFMILKATFIYEHVMPRQYEVCEGVIVSKIL